MYFIFYRCVVQFLSFKTKKNQRPKYFFLLELRPSLFITPIWLNTILIFYWSLLMYLKCALFFPLGWKFYVSNVLWNWSLRLETRPELQFKRSKITPRKHHLFVPRSGSLQFFPFIFTSVTNSLSQTNLLVSWDQYLYEVCTMYILKTYFSSIKAHIC